jgi:hypothetical protein
MNVFLLLKTKQAILADPCALEMHSWNACVAGLAARLAGVNIHEESERTKSTPYVVASRLLKVAPREAQKLFHFHIEGDYNRLCRHDKAQRAARIIDDVIRESQARSGFRQQTFPGKPLSDEDVIHANRIAEEIGDEAP